MLTKNKIFAIIIILSAKVSLAQDIHFSNYYALAQQLNPALIGNFNGSYRVAAIYRNQGIDYLGGNSFSTPGVMADIPLFSGHLNRDKLYLGAMFINDKAGKASINNINASLGIGYHRGLGRYQSSQISIGFQGAYLNKRLDNSAVVFYDQFDAISWTGAGSTADIIPTNTLNLFDFNAGFYFKTKFSEKLGMYIGSVAHHINQPSESIIVNNVNFHLPMRLNADLGFKIGLNDKWSIKPEALYQQINNNKETVFGLMAEYKVRSGFRDNNAFHFGAKYRWDDAILAIVAVEFRNCTLGMSYDFNTSSLSQSSKLRGGFEMSLVYVGEDIKNYNARKSLPCRRF
jgi:type IX secretion system PorP/SprF family membrane protein